MDGFADGGNSTGFGQPEPGPACHQAGQAARETGRDSGQGPKPDRQADAAIEADAIDQKTRERRGRRVRHGKRREDPTVIGIVQSELRANYWSERSQ